ncbi:MAG: hypothetical protein GXO50_07880 [Chlorobi bacterium]|nr:hypothetical protein [Chlorobiota bacterium]
MKKQVFIVAIVLFFTASNILSQTNVNVGVAVSRNYTGCGTATDLGYYYVHSEVKKRYDLYREVKREAANRYGGSVTEAELNYNGENYLIIIGCSAITSGGCRKYNYGVGFGFCYSEALENAKKNLKESGQYTESSLPYEIIVSEEF